MSPSPTPSPSPSPSPPPQTAAAKKSKAKAPVQLIGDLPRAEADALRTFVELRQCEYQNSKIGRSRNVEEGLACECVFNPETDPPHVACGLNSDCINILTQIECLENECKCGEYCQNQRFAKRQFADLHVVKTEMKGFGLRAATDLDKDEFVYEYLGEIVDANNLSRRMKQYASEGIKHFYFMMLQKEEFIDATKKGGLGRFANHSCNPNCYVAKWTVGKRVRMGIFANRRIQKDEELTFNYNVDRYGHEAQPCYCGEANCIGQLGGKTQTDVATLDDLFLSALGISDEVSLLGLKGSKKKKGRKLDEDYNPVINPLLYDDVPKVIQALRQATSNLIVLRLLRRIGMTNEDMVLRQGLRLRIFSALNPLLEEWIGDHEVLLAILEALERISTVLLYRNKVDDSNIEVPVTKCLEVDNEGVKTLAQALLDRWGKLNKQHRIAKRQWGKGESQIVSASYSIYGVTSYADTSYPHATSAQPVFERPAKRPRVEGEEEETGEGSASPKAKQPPTAPRAFKDSNAPVPQPIDGANESLRTLRRWPVSVRDRNQERGDEWRAKFGPLSVAEDVVLEQQRLIKELKHKEPSVVTGYQFQRGQSHLVFRPPEPVEPKKDVRLPPKEEMKKIQEILEAERAKAEEIMRTFAEAINNPNANTNDNEEEVVAIPAPPPEKVLMTDRELEERAEERMRRRREQKRRELRASGKTKGRNKEALREKHMRKMVGAVVVKGMRKWQKTLTHDQFKEHARAMTEKIAESELKRSDGKEIKELSEKQVTKMYGFIKGYMEKVIYKLKKERKASGSTSTSNAAPAFTAPVAGPSSSGAVDTPSTGTEKTEPATPPDDGNTDVRMAEAGGEAEWDAQAANFLADLQKDLVAGEEEESEDGDSDREMDVDSEGERDAPPDGLRAAEQREHPPSSPPREGRPLSNSGPSAIAV